LFLMLFIYYLRNSPIDKIYNCSWLRLTQSNDIPKMTDELKHFGMFKKIIYIFLQNIQGIHKRMVRFQKLTRNLFLTLHGHNVHRQQWQLSKFFMRYQCFSIVFFNSAGSEVLQKETTTFSLGHPVRRIKNHAISFFGGSLNTAFTYHHCPCP